MAEWLKLDQTVADLAAKGEAAGNQALADDKDKKVEKAKAALVEAAGKAATAVAKVLLQLVLILLLLLILTVRYWLIQLVLKI